jgi:hypothetical protein
MVVECSERCRVSGMERVWNGENEGVAMAEGLKVERRES